MIVFIKRKIFRNSRDRWNYQYEKGKWEFLKQPDEDERFQTVIRFIEQYKLGGNLLEIGCGEALLQQKINSNHYAHFTGIDVSDIAIENANRYKNSKTAYWVADMETYVPSHLMDAIIFTESIYYSKNPAKLLQRYRQFLKSEGIFIISIFDFKYSTKVWQQIESICLVLEHTSTTNYKGTWQCKVLTPR